MAIGLGLAALGRPGYINLGHGGDIADRGRERMERAAHDVLDAAYDAGVRAFDAARSYGAAEEFLAAWLRRRGLARADVYVSSKWGYAYTAGWRVDAEHHEVKDLGAGQLRRQWAETRALLGEHIRLYQIHSATLESGVLDDAAVRAELDAIRAEGVLIGLSVTGAGPAGDDRARPRRSAASTPCRRRGTCTSARRSRRSRAHTTRGCASTSRRRSRTAGSPRAAATTRWPPRRASAARPRTRWRSPPRSRGRGRTSC